MAIKLCSAASEAMQRVGNLADCTLVAVDGSSYKVSKAVTAMHSNVLGTMFNDISPVEERVQLDDSSDEVACLVNHLYGGVAFLIDIDSILPCSRLARKYDMPQLQKAVDMFVEQLELSESNVPHYTVVAFDNPAMDKLKVRCLTYASWQLDKIINGRIDAKLNPTDWLEALPKSTLIELIHLRGRAVGGAVKVMDGDRIRAGVNISLLSQEEVVQLERQMVMDPHA